MILVNSVCDVFLAASRRDAGVAEVVRRAFEDSGLVVFSSATMELGSDFSNAIREAIAESRVFVALLTPSFVRSSHLPLEIGGAWAWEKPIYLLLESLSPKDVPSYLKRYKAIPTTKLADAVASIARSAKPLSEQQREQLTRLYADLGVSSDQLALQPDTLDTLTRSFNEAVATRFSPERVLQEIVRLRKQGKLPRLRSRRPRPERKA
jgi:TIR domain